MVIIKNLSKIFVSVCTLLFLCIITYAGSAVNRYNDMAPPSPADTAVRLAEGISENASAPSYSLSIIFTVLGIGVLLFALVIGLGMIGRSRR